MMLLCFGCQWQLKRDEDADAAIVNIARYDRIESLYLTTGDYSALQQMNTYFPMQTRTLIEDVLHIGKVDDPETNRRFLRFFQDSTLQRMLIDVQQQYTEMDDINEELASAFEHLQDEMPALIVPDCLGFYLLSLYPIPSDVVNTQEGRDQHMSKIQWVVNEVTGRDVFHNAMISDVNEYMKNNREQSFDEMLRSSNKTIFK